MKIIKPSVEFFGTVPTDYESAIRFIEMAGRICYKSEDKITDDSAEKFVKCLIKNNHLVMVEHSNFVARADTPSMFVPYIGKYLQEFRNKMYIYIGGNLTAWKNFASEERLFTRPFLQEYGRLNNFPIIQVNSSDAWQVCPYNEIPPELHRYSAKFICDRGVSHELVRHRLCSFAQESTRYVNYGGKDMEFIEPNGFDAWPIGAQSDFLHSCRMDEIRYNDLLRSGIKPQQARAVLPNALKTEIIVTADAAEWNHIRNLRTSKAAHPDMQRVMNMIPWEKFL